VPLSRSRDYLSIGEVLDNLKADFPDASISKIRFLESEGLISPERTPSGYRKFYEADLERLRLVLSLQRDHFLPLRVIKERLRVGDLDGGSPTGLSSPIGLPRAGGNGHAGGEQGPVSDPGGGGAVSSVQLDRGELTAATGLTDEQLKGLEEFGILSGAEPYDENDLVVGKAAKRFFDFGVEARHLRMYRQFAEREAAFFEQIVAPGARRNDPGAREEATRSVDELAGLSRQMKEAALRSSLRAIR
jgi:DNA-binding transcriptional MerR regulator